LQKVCIQQSHKLALYCSRLYSSHTTWRCIAHVYTAVTHPAQQTHAHYMICLSLTVYTAC